MHICVDMGHTPTSPGASKFLNELVEDRRVGDALIAELKNRGHRVTNTTPPNWMGYPQEINNRISSANRSGANLLVSIHFNAGGGTGTEVLYYPGDNTGYSYASRISSKVSNLLGIPNRGPKPRNNVGVVANTTMTAVLVEVCFVDHNTDKDAYFASSPEAIAAAIADGIEGTNIGVTAPAPSVPTPKPNAPSRNVNVRYRAKVGGEWLSEVVNFNNQNSDGFAGIPCNGMTAVAIGVDRGSIKYRVHVVGGDWYPWVTGYNINDFDNGFAGDGSSYIDGIQIYYNTPGGESYQQAWYRSQTTVREGWLGVCCDDGNSVDGYDGWAGMYGEPMDRLQIAIGNSNPF